MTDLLTYKTSHNLYYVKLYKLRESMTNNAVTTLASHIGTAIKRIERSTLRNWTIAVMASTALGYQPAFAMPEKASVWPLESSQIQMTRDVVTIMREKAFRKQPLNDSFSAELMDNYLDMLDPNHYVFTQADIQEFNLSRNALDDELANGQLTTPRAIYQRYYERYTARLQWAIDHIVPLVNAPIVSTDAIVEIDRKKSPWPTDEKAADLLWENSVRDAILSLELADKKPDEIITTLTRRFTNQLVRIKKLTPMDNFEVFMNAYTELYDPHTNYMAPKTSDNFDISMSLSLEGIGAVLEKDDEYTKVTRLVTAGPAAKAGELAPGDRIVAIAQGQNSTEWEDVIGWRLDEVVELIRGNANTWVRLQIKRGEDEIRTIAILREKVKLEDQAVSKNVINIKGETTGKNYKIGVITVPSFYLDFDAMRRQDPNTRSTTRDVLRALQELKNEPIDGLIVDLRDNGGGSLLEATQLTDLFIEQGPVVQILNAEHKVDRRNKAVNPIYYNGPMMVLVNHLSASASEIFAGAIQDYNRGLIIGEQTFGKGTVQTLIPLYQGKLKITESKFYRVSGESTQHRGVVPDIHYPSSFPFDEVGESALEHALPWDTIEPAPHYMYKTTPNLTEALTKQHELRMKNNVEYIALLDQRTFMDAQRARKSLPLNKERRIALKNQDEAKLLSINNSVRQHKGLPPLKTVSELEDAMRKKRDDKKPEEDFLLMETGNIVVNFIERVQPGKQEIVNSTPASINAIPASIRKRD